MISKEKWRWRRNRFQNEKWKGRKRHQKEMEGKERNDFKKRRKFQA